MKSLQCAFQEHTKSIAVYLNRLNRTLETSVDELIQLFMSRANVSEGLDYESKTSVHGKYGQLTHESVAKCFVCKLY